MFSKFAIAGFSVLVLTFVSACSLKTNDKAIVFDSLRYKTGKYGCLSSMGNEVNSYLQGEMTESGVKEFISCMKSALNAFEFHARGKELDRYTPLEIADFLNKNFLHESKLTDPMVKEIMTIKNLMVGGGEKFISRYEFTELVNFLNVVQEEAILNLPYVRLYKIKIEFSILDRVDPVLLRAAKNQLLSTTKRLADHLSQSGVSYGFDSFERLLNETRSFLNWKAFNQDAMAAADLSELLSRFKEITVGDDRRQIKAQEWQPFLAATAGVYGAYLDFEYLVSNQNILYGSGLEDFIQMADSFLGILQTAIKQQTQKVIEFSAIDGLIDALDKMKLMPMGIRGESLKPALKYTIQRVLKDPASNINADTVSGLNLSNLGEARKEFYNWAESQRFLNLVAEKELRKLGILDKADHVPMYFSLLKIFDFRPLFEGPHPEYQEKNIEYLVKSVTPLFRVGDNRVWIAAFKDRPKYEILHGIHDLGRLNVIRAVVRQLVRGFANQESRVALLDTDPGATGVTDAEMEKFYQTARHIGEDLLFMDPRKDKVGFRIFKEGNIFTYAGNGIQEPGSGKSPLLGFTEIVEVVSLMWSGGQVRDALHARISEICEAETGSKPELDIMNTVKIDRACFFKHLSDNEFLDFSNLPNMQTYLNGLKVDELKVFYSLIEDLSKIPDKKDSKDSRGCYDAQHIELAEIATLATVAHYVEIIFSIYDRDQSGSLSQYEIMSAFPRFRGFLAQALREDGQSEKSVRMLKAIFAFIVREKRKPTSTMDGIGVKLDSWAYSKDSDVVDVIEEESIDVDRAGMLKILVMLNAPREKKSPRDPVPLPVEQCPVH